MGIRTTCPNGHKLNVKAFLAGLRGICPHCGASFTIPTESTRSPSKGRARESAEPGIPSAVAASAATAGSAVAASTGLPEPRPVSQRAASPDVINRPPPLPLDGEDLPPQPAGSPGNVAVRRTANGPAIGQSPGAAFGSAPLSAAVSFDRQPSSSPLPVQPNRADDAFAGPLGGVPAAPAMQPPPAVQPSDPLAEVPDAVWYVRPASGGQFGPATNEIMRTWLGEGRIGPDSLVWREGWRDWKAASTTFPQFGTDPGNLGALLATGDSTVRHPTAAHHAPGHRRVDGTGILLISLLFLAVIALVGVLCWVFFWRSEGATASTAATSSRALAVIDGPAESWNPRVL